MYTRLMHFLSFWISTSIFSIRVPSGKTRHNAKFQINRHINDPRPHICHFFSTDIFSTQIFLHTNLEQKRHKFLWNAIHCSNSLQKSEISQHDRFFSTDIICDICDKYEVCVQQQPRLMTITVMMMTMMILMMLMRSDQVLARGRSSSSAEV